MFRRRSYASLRTVLSVVDLVRSGLQLAKQSLTFTVVNNGFVHRRSGYQIRLDYLQKVFVGEGLKK